MRKLVELLMRAEKDILLEKLDEFTRKYYKNQLLKGALYSTGLLLTAFLTVSLLEYFGEFSPLVRGILFFSFISASLLITGYYLIVPLLKLYKIGVRLSNDQAAEIIGRHFTDVQDKLLNVLQLQQRKGISGSEELWLASIDQKVEELRPLPFTAAIDLTENKKYLRYVLPVLSFTAIIAVIWPHILTKSTERIVNYSTYYEKEMPFKLVVTNTDLNAAQAEDFLLEVTVEGKEVPSDLSLLVNGITYKMDKDDITHFSHLFPNIQTTTEFQLVAGGFTSKPYTIAVLPKASLMKFGIKLHYPKYLNRNDEVLSNNGDIEIPQGTEVEWQFTTRNTESMTVTFSNDTVLLTHAENNGFLLKRKFMQSAIYGIRTLNHYLPKGGDSVQYKVNVIADQYPVIELQTKQDSLTTGDLYFSGQLRDDYGFSSLAFHFKRYYKDSTGKDQEQSGVTTLGVNKNAVAQPFFHLLSISEFNPGPGEKYEYYFEVTDNDGVNGPKSSRTPVAIYKTPTTDELQEATDKSNSEIEKTIEESIKKSKQLQKDINDLLKRIADKKQPGYEEKKKLEELLKQQKQLEQKINQAQQQNEKNSKRQQEFSEPMSEQLMEKQQQLEKLFESVLTPEMKRLFEEMNKLLEQMDKNKVQEKLEELKLTNKDIEKELDRNLEAFKQLEVQQKMENALEKLEELKNRQEELKEQTTGKKEQKNEKTDKKDEGKEDKKDGNKDSQNKEDKNAKDEKSPADKQEKLSKEELAKKQEELKKDFEKLQEELKELREKNAALEEPMKMPDTKQKEQEINNSLEKSSNELQKGHNQKAGESQKDAAEKMNEMQQDMQESMEEQEAEQEGENAETLRQVIENLLHLSFEQEKLLNAAAEIRPDNPRYTDLPRQQMKLRDDSKMIEDSLLALAKRAPQISATVNRAISSIHSNMDKTIKSLADRNVAEGRMRMQQTMTSVNELAVMLDESLEQMQQQMQQKKKSKGEKGSKCKKPGKNSGQNPSSQGNPVTNMRKMQEQLNKQLKEMKEAMEKGQKPGQKPGEKPGDKPGQKPGMGQGQGSPGSEQFARMAAQQEALRRQMEELMSQLKKEGKNPGGDVANMMEETEKDLVNKQLTNETLRRQQQILTRLLESEKAAQEREQDEQRKSNEAKSQNSGNPERFLEYKRMREKEMELLNTVPPGLTPYYREKVTNYFNSLQNGTH